MQDSQQHRVFQQKCSPILCWFLGQFYPIVLSNANDGLIERGVTYGQGVWQVHQMVAAQPKCFWVKLWPLHTYPVPELAFLARVFIEQHFITQRSVRDQQLLQWYIAYRSYTAWHHHLLWTVMSSPIGWWTFVPGPKAPSPTPGHKVPL